jgi:L-threonylcarbamoyladenylate synthase
MTSIVEPNYAGIARAAATLRAGGLVAFPTETVYGLGADAFNPVAVQRIFDAKGRPSSDPLIVHIASMEALTTLVTDVPAVVRELASRFWPGPLTLVLPRSPAVPDVVTAGFGTVAVRIPAHPVARALLEAASTPVAAPSANLFSRPSPTRAEHVLQDLGNRIDLIIDAGPTSVGLESTVLDLTTGVPTILRPGAVTIEMLRDVLSAVAHGNVTIDAEPMRSPGLMTKHYAPEAPLTLYEGEPQRVIARIAEDARRAHAEGKRVGVIAAADDAIAGFNIIRLGHERDLTAVATRLYAALRDLDVAGVDLILARGFDATSGLGVAIQDRLRRAAAGRVVVVSN